MALICAKCEKEHDYDAPCLGELKLRRRTFIFGTLGLVAATALPLVAAKTLNVEEAVANVRRGYVGISTVPPLPGNPLRDGGHVFSWTPVIDGKLSSLPWGGLAVPATITDSLGRPKGVLPPGETRISKVLWHGGPFVERHRDDQ